MQTFNNCTNGSYLLKWVEDNHCAFYNHLEMVAWWCKTGQLIKILMTVCLTIMLSLITLNTTI